MDHNRSSPGIEGQGHRSRSRLRVKVAVRMCQHGRLTSIFVRGQFVFQLIRSLDSLSRRNSTPKVGVQMSINPWEMGIGLRERIARKPKWNRD